MSAIARLFMAPESQEVIDRQGDAAQKLPGAIDGALRQGLAETANHLKSDYLRGGSIHEHRNGQLPLASRSGALEGSIVSDVDQPMSGYVGSAAGPASKYAKVLLGAGTWTIKPINAKHLWIPVADNVGPGGQARLSPREAMSQVNDKGKRLLQFIYKAGIGLIAGFTGGYVPGVRRKSFKLLFALKDQVVVKGTDALARAVEDKRGRVAELITDAVRSTVSGGGGGAGGGAA